MVLQKRKRSFDDDVELVDSSDAESSNDVDISSVLTGKKSKFHNRPSNRWTYLWKSLMLKRARLIQIDPLLR